MRSWILGTFFPIAVAGLCLTTSAESFGSQRIQRKSQGDRCWSTENMGRKQKTNMVKQQQWQRSFG